ncbi:MAG TPA: ATP-binding protein [Spirochaetales bacterium]|nr:ATP-binding protein [Spirochaetales bacterium]HRZ65828.1 ATP-binding protein [Spirochaetia bacterium]
MTLAAADFSGRVTFITGPEKGSGKTTLLNYALGLLREAGEAPAFLGIGLEGDGAAAAPFRRSAGPGGAAPRFPLVSCRPGELFLSAGPYLRDSSCLPEVLESLPGSTALGRLAVVRARRAGRAVLVGAERNEHTALAIAAMLEPGRARTILVDGAINRITQISSLPGSAPPRFLFAVRASPGDLGRNLRAMARVYGLSRLPLEGSGPLPEPVCRVEGPLTAATLARVPAEARSLVVEDLTKVFLDERELAALRRDRVLALRRGLEFGGFVVSLRDLSPSRFSRELGDPALEELVAYGPFEARVA